MRGDGVLGQDAAVRVGQRQLERCERLDLREDVVARVVDGAESLAGVVIVDPGMVGHGGQSTRGVRAPRRRAIPVRPPGAGYASSRATTSARYRRNAGPTSSRSIAISTVAFR